MCGADVAAACMKTEEVIEAFTRAARCAVRKQVDGMGTIYAPQKFSTSLDSAYHGFSFSKGNGEHSPQRAEWIGDDDFGLHATSDQSLTPYRTAVSVFVDSLVQHNTKRRRTSRKPTQDDNNNNNNNNNNKSATVVAVPEVVDQVDRVNALPDECLQEIFGFLPRVQDRLAAASVCMRWLMLQSRMHRGDFKTEPTRSSPKAKSVAAKSELKPATEKVKPEVSEDRSDETEEDGADEVQYCGNQMDVDEQPRVQRQPQWALGELSRKFEDMKATDVKLALVAIGELARGGLGTLKVIGGSAPGGKGVTDSGLIAIGNCCAALRSLTLWDCEHVTDVGLAAIGKGCRLLEKLDLMKCPGVGERGLEAVAKGCPLLSTVNIDSCATVGNASVDAFGKWSGALSSFSVSNCPQVGSAGIGTVTLGCTRLKKLKLEKLKLSNDGLVAIGENCKSVTRMKLANLVSVTEEGFLGLCAGAGLQQLKSLVITCCPGMTDASLELVGKVCQDLKLCALSQCQSVTDKGLQAFMQRCVCLDSLQLERCHSITNSGLLNALAQGKGNLRTLSLSKCDGLRNGMEPIVTTGFCCPSLENLNLSHLTNLSDQGIVSVIQGCGKHLVSLNLTDCTNVTDVAVAAIASHCGELERLTLDSCYRVGDHGPQMVAAECTLLKEVDLSGTSITDAGLQKLVTSRGLWLRSLTLTGCVNLTDKSLGLIEDCCPSLGALNLRNCPLFSTEGLSSLESQLWSCDDFVCS